MSLFFCPCGFSAPLAKLRFPLHCRCGTRYAGPSDAKVAKPHRPQPRTAPCIHLGEPVRTAECSSCAGRVRLKVFSCAVHGECTTAKQLPGVACCGTWGTCPDYQPRPLYADRFMRTSELMDATHKLAHLLPRDTSAIAGIPRSGMLVASYLSTLLHVPLCSVDGYPDPRRLVRVSAGGRMVGHAEGSGPIAIVDDTTCAGHTMRAVRKALGESWEGRRLVYAAAFGLPAGGPADIYAASLAIPHLLEWNLFCAPWGPQQVATDCDGILCEDGAADYSRAAPKYLFRRDPISLVITARPESDRQVTEAWLARHGMHADRLEMWPGDPQSRTFETIARWKAGIFKTARQCYYVESCEHLAQKIARLSGKATVCPASGRVYR